MRTFIVKVPPDESSFAGSDDWRLSVDGQIWALAQFSTFNFSQLAVFSQWVPTVPVANEEEVRSSTVIDRPPQDQVKKYEIYPKVQYLQNHQRQLLSVEIEQNKFLKMF